MKKTAIKILALLICVCLIFGCAVGCATKADPTGSNPAVTTPDPTKPDTSGGGGNDGDGDGKKDDVVCIDGCDVPRYDDDGNEVFAVVSPVGYCDVDMIEQAPRLDTLSNKTIALVGGSFMASTTHFELKRCIEEEYENVTIYMFNEVGSAGNFAVPSKGDSDSENDDKTNTQVQRFQKKLKELGVDAVIGGNGGCGICTMKETGSAIAAEYIGIPAVMVASPMFTEEVHSIGVSRGVPVIRTAEYPGAFATHTEEQLKDNARKIVWPQVKTALTTQITQAEINLYKNDGERPYDEVIYYGNNDEVQDYFKYNEWTDGLPIGLPTPAKVKEYLKFTPYEEDFVLGGDDGMILQANRRNYVYTVAVNAVMSGVPAEFMPLCVAFVECMDYGEWYRPLISSHQWSPYAWLNGPVARQLGIDYSQGAISEETNKALGRFIDLAMLNIGGYYVKENRAGTFGYLTPFTFAEDEESCLDVGWMPYPSQVVKDYSLDKNYITAASALTWGNNIATSTSDAEQIMKTMAFDITEKQENGLGTIDPHVYRTMLITRDVAAALSEKYKSKGALETALIETARRPVIERVYALYYGNTGSQPSKNYTFDEYYDKVLEELEALKTNTDPAKQFDADVRMTSYPEWLQTKENKDQQILTFATMKKGETPMIVMGDTSRNKFQVMPGGGYATVEIKLPNNWDELLAPLGYEPLANFYLSDKYAEPEITDINAPDGLPDGTYQIVSRQSGVGAKKIYFNADTVYFYIDNEIQTIKTGNAEAFATLLKNLKAPCGIVIKDGIVTEVIIRPTSAAQGSAETNISALYYSDFGTAKITFAINLKQSGDDGGVSRSGTTVTISSTIEQMSLKQTGLVDELDTFTIDASSTPDFITYSNGMLTINQDAAGGSVCILKSANGNRTLTFTQKADRTITIEYNSGETA